VLPLTPIVITISLLLFLLFFLLFLLLLFLVLLVFMFLNSSRRFPPFHSSSFVPPSRRRHLLFPGTPCIYPEGLLTFYQSCVIAPPSGSRKNDELFSVS